MSQMLQLSAVQVLSAFTIESAEITCVLLLKFLDETLNFFTMLVLLLK